MAKQTIGQAKQILHDIKYKAITVTVADDIEGLETVNGRKVVPAGTLLVGQDGSVFANRQTLVEVADAAEGDIDGVLLNDVDVSDGPQVAALVYAGTIYSDKVVGYTEAVDAKLPRIQFVASA